ncbi:MAG TPA: FlgO family outer membrane protein [Bryobacteraceae bacterium]|nr:FlgO family outer membrane protein [Bryobacteraceae bacterium]
MFSTAAGQSRFLRFVVEETLQGRAGLLKEYSIGVEAFGRGESFDPRQDSIVRVEARKLRSNLAEYYQAEGRYDPARIELRKGAYIPTFTRWASADSPGAELKPVLVDPGRRETGRRRRMAMGVGILLAALSTGALFWTLPRPDRAAGSARTLLILPFRSLDGGDLGEGVSEQVTARLMMLPGLRLISSAAAQRVESSGANPQEAGKRLNVDAVLTGSVRRADRKVRVNAQLIRTEDGQVLWAEGGLEVESRDLLEAERLLSTAIATRLHVPLSRRERNAMARTSTSSVEAYELFVRGKLAMRGGGENFSVAEQLFQKATTLDPAFAEALAWLGLAQYSKFHNGSAGDEARRAGLENARKALAIDPTVTAGRRALIAIFHSTGQAEEGLKEASILRKSGARDFDSLSAMAQAYFRAGMPDRSAPLCRQALELDPDAASGCLAEAAYHSGQYELGLRVEEADPRPSLYKMENALALGRRALARSVALDILQNGTQRGGLLVVVLAGYVLQELGEAPLAEQIWRERVPVLERRLAGIRNERQRIGLGLIYAGLGDKPRALEQVRLALETNPGDPWSLFYASEIHAQLDDQRKALETLRQAVDRGFLALHYLDEHFKHWPKGLHRFRNHPEFLAVREQLASKVALLRQQY